MQHLTIHIALDDQHEENGVLYYVPGSNKWDLLPITSRHFGDMDSIREVLKEEQLEQFNKKRAGRLSGGFASFHHPLTVHGSYENRSEHNRRATVVNLMKDGTKSDSNEPLLEGLPSIKQGETLKGKFFPLLN